MDWTAPIDAYCERLGPTFWAEPVNAITNAAFVVAAWVMFYRTSGTRTAVQATLIALLAMIGIGSFLFHTFATPWAAASDVLPILLFILAYVFAANRDFWGWTVWRAILGTLAFLPYAAVAAWIFARLPFFEISAAYWPVPLLIAAYATLLPDRTTAVGLFIGAALLTLSLTFRSLDQTLCPALPIGTHFLWHILNASMLAWMIEVHRRHLAAHAATS
ncbi:MAG: ceramidase domain-containing protein [Pseudomonadota bacterium]